MKVNVTSSKGLESKLSVIVTKKEIQEKIDKKLDEVKDTINLKGFRPGKAPRELLKKQFGKALYGEVIEKTLNDSAFQALKDKNIKPAGQPKIDIKSSGEDKDLEFTIEVEKVPEIKKVDLSKIEIEKYEVKADKKDLETRLNSLAESSKKYNEKDASKTAANNDLVEFNYEATVDGKSFEGNKAEKLQIVLGKDLFIKGFDKQIIGVKKNDEKVVKINLPDNYPKKELAGKASEFKCKITNIKSPEEQKIDDAFAKNMGAKDLSDLKSMIEKQISKEFESITDQLCKKEILDQLDKQFKIDLPKGMLDTEVKTVEHTMIHEKMHEKGEKDHSKIKLDENDKKEVKKISDRRVKLALVLANIGEEHSIKVSSQELQSELEKQLRMYPGQEKTIREYYQKNPAELAKLRGPIFEDKVLNLIKDKAKTKVKSITKEELQNIISPNSDNKTKSKTKTTKKATAKKASTKKTSKK
ncbi:trigger factor [Candidatus Pelagibacter sp. HIMB1517]|uniref:trigger factor n=1 Tax=Candidatus Pelagibacter sp. HIMB1517 TaxID=3413341 RepID=UPI003F87BE3C